MTRTEVHRDHETVRAYAATARRLAERGKPLALPGRDHEGRAVRETHTEWARR